MQEKIQQSYALCGYLDKKSPSILKGWQKRYFQVRDSGSMLLYYKKAPNGADAKPSGVLSFLSMKSVSPVLTSKVEFYIIVHEREFHVRAQNEQSRQDWMEKLIFLMELKLKKDKESKEKESNTMSILDLSYVETPGPISTNTGSETSKNNISAHKDWSDLDKDTMNRIKLEDEKSNYLKVESKIEEKNEEVLRAKCIYPFIAKYDQDVINRHVICGFLQKKGKIAKLSVAKRRWFFMISSVVINGDADNNDRINQSDIPAVFKLDSIYYFAYEQKGDKSNFTGKIVIDECEKPELMSLDKNSFIIQKSLPFGFTLYNKKDFRQYNLFSEHLTEVNKWVRAIQAVFSRPNKNVPRGSKLYTSLPGTVVTQEQEDDDQFLEEEIIFESKVNKKHHNKLLTGPLSWRLVTLQLKTNIISWHEKNKDKDENTNLYVLLINVLKVEGANRSWVIFTTDGEEHKFKAETSEKKEEWVTKIQAQVVLNKGTFKQEDLQATNDKIDPSMKKKDDESDDDDDITKTYYKMMEIAMNKDKKNESQDNGPEDQSFLSKIFCCCNGKDEKDETDRGF